MCSFLSFYISFINVPAMKMCTFLKVSINRNLRIWLKLVQERILWCILAILKAYQTVRKTSQIFCKYFHKSERGINVVLTLIEVD